jgi:hypothetical protein
MLPWSVSAVTCVAACPDGSVFAAGYEDGKVEVFDAVVYNRLAVSALFTLVYYLQQPLAILQQLLAAAGCLPFTCSASSQLLKTAVQRQSSN